MSVLFAAPAATREISFVCVYYAERCTAYTPSWLTRAEKWPARSASPTSIANARRCDSAKMNIGWIARSELYSPIEKDVIYIGMYFEDG